MGNDDPDLKQLRDVLSEAAGQSYQADHDLDALIGTTILDLFHRIGATVRSWSARRRYEEARLKFHALLRERQREADDR
jgi:hypothetical protein